MKRCIFKAKDRRDFFWVLHSSRILSMTNRTLSQKDPIALGVCWGGLRHEALGGTDRQPCSGAVQSAPITVEYMHTEGRAGQNQNISSTEAPPTHSR